MKKLFLVDVSSMFFRAFYAIPPLSNDQGLPTNALYGFLSMSLKLLKDMSPDYMVYCFDRKEPSFRFELYNQYKANRSEMPEELVPQVPYIRKLAEALGIACIDKETFEADDVIGSLTHWGRKNDLEVVIVSGDKDFAQLVGPNVSMYDTMKDVRYDEAGVVAKWGVNPPQMIDYLSLVGDSSDNIPGVKGIGPKGAEKLLKEFGSLEGIYENIEAVSGAGLKKKLIEGKDLAFLSRKLVTIVADLDLVENPEALVLQKVDRDQLKELLLFLGFKTFVKNLIDSTEADADPRLGIQSQFLKRSSKSAGSKGKAVEEKNIEGVDELPVKTTGEVKLPKSLKELSVNLEELYDLIPPYSEIFILDTSRGFSLVSGDKILQVQADIKEVGKALNGKKLLWKGFDLKKSWHLLGLKTGRVHWDSQLAAYVLNSNSAETFDQAFEKFCNDKVPDLASFSEIYLSHLHLEQKLRSLLTQTKDEEILQNVEFPLERVLFEMEHMGIELNVDELTQQSRGLVQDLKELEKSIYQESGGTTFNIASPKQLGEILFDKMGLPRGKKTKTGYSTSSDVLEKLQTEYPIAKLILEYRELAKLKSTYVDALPHLVRDDGRVHSEFRQAVAATGRLSSVNPNLQNIPIRTERGRQVRKAFVAKKGHVLLSADYSQIELRVLAHITEDPGLLAAFAEDQDIHAATAAEVFSVNLSEVTADQRRTAKAINFGIAYGQGAFGLAETLGVSRSEATSIIDKYFRKFKNVREFMDTTIEKAKVDGYVETLMGRRRYIPELKSSNQMLRKFGERAAINAPIQGTASDIVKVAMIEAYNNVSAALLLQVHDELLFEVPEDEVYEQVPYIVKAMEESTRLKVPLKVNLSFGPNWEAKRSIDTSSKL